VCDIIALSSDCIEIECVDTTDTFGDCQKFLCNMLQPANDFNVREIVSLRLVSDFFLTLLSLELTPDAFQHFPPASSHNVCK
jgi:hypothetical protein